MDGQMDGQTGSDRRTCMSEEACCWLARQEKREHLPAGLRSSHGFCESGSPPTPAAGQEGPRRRQRVRGITNRHLERSQMSVISLLTSVYHNFTLRQDLKLRLFRQTAPAGRSHGSNKYSDKTSIRTEALCLFLATSANATSANDSGKETPNLKRKCKRCRFT